MKKTILTAFILTNAVSIFAQGTVIFDNRVGGSAPVLGPDGSPLAGANFFAELLGAPGSNAPESSLLANIGPASTFRNGLAAGFVASSTATFNNILPDAPVASFEMVAWDNSSGLYPTWAQASVAWQFGLIAAGKSPEFALQNIGGFVNTPPTLFPGLVSFSIPEPETTALAGLGATMFLILRRRN